VIDKLTKGEKTALTLLVAGQVLSIFTWYLGADAALTIAAALPWIRLVFAIVASAALDLVVVVTTTGRRDGRRSGWGWATILSAAAFSAAIALDVAGGPSLGPWLHACYAVNIFLFAQHVAHPRAQTLETTRTIADMETEVAQLRADLELSRATEGVDPRRLAQQMALSGVATRTIARMVERPESTVRGWLAAATNGHATLAPD
jgi:hypothetical protein